MSVPDDRLYTKEHEWLHAVGKTATVGITDHAQEQLGDVVFVELPELGEAVTRGDTVGVVESVKAVSDIYAPASGEITEINDGLKDNPQRVNEDAYGEAWMYRVELSNTDELEELLTHEQYQAYLAEESS